MLVLSLLRREGEREKEIVCARARVCVCVCVCQQNEKLSNGVKREARAGAGGGCVHFVWLACGIDPVTRISA